MSAKIEQLEASDLIALAAVYLDEWTHRNTILWQHAMQLFFASILTMFVPHIIGFLDKESLPFQNWMFYLLGVIICVASLIILLAAQRRIRIIGDRLRNVYSQLPQECRTPNDIAINKESSMLLIKPFVSAVNKILRWRLNKALLAAMFCSLAILGLLLIANTW